MTSHRRRPGLPSALIVAAVLVALSAGAFWYLTGGRGQIVATPSMGRAAPVGTLVLTRPADDIRVGDVITYRPPNPLVHHTTTHRVIAVDAQAAGGPTYKARGDINGADDPWTLRHDDLVGRAVALGWGLGWLLRAIPPLLAGVLLIWWVTRRWATPFWRVPTRVFGLSLLVSGVIAWLKPFVGAITMNTTADAAGSHITLVSTGLLPIRVTAATGGQVDLVDGQTGVLTTALPDGAKGAVLTSGVHMPWWLWVVMTLVWLTPMFGGLLTALRHPPPDDRGGPPAGRSRHARRRRTRSRAVASTLAFTTVLALGTATTGSAFTSTVINSVNTAATAPGATTTTCRAATLAADPYLDWPLSDATVGLGSTAADVSGNGRPGTYVGTFTSTTGAPCPRDTPARALAANATAVSFIVPTASVTNINVFTVAIWFRTTTTLGGRLIGWGNARIGASTVDDRHLYMTDAGTIVFGLRPSGLKTVVSPRSYNDGQWHLAVGTLSAAGMALYLDGTSVATDATTTTGAGGSGYWRVGWDTLSGWPSNPTNDTITGNLAWATVYHSALTATQVQTLYSAGS